MTSGLVGGVLQCASKCEPNDNTNEWPPFAPETPPPPAIPKTKGSSEISLR